MHPARRPQDRHQRTDDADRRAGRGEPAAQRGVLSIPPNTVATPRALLAAAAGGADHQLPAAHALPRHADDARGDSSRRPARDADRREPLRAELADHLHLQDAASLPGGDDPPHHLVPRQHRRTTSTTPIPTSWRGWGSRTMDEMGHGWTDIAFLTDAQYQEELAKRTAAKKPDRRISSSNSSSTPRRQPLRSPETIGLVMAGSAAQAPGRRSSACNESVRHMRASRPRRAGAHAGAACRRFAASARSRAPRTASGAPGPATSAPRATRRSIRSTRRTSASSKSPGASRPTTSARVPTSTCRPRR